MLAMEKDHNGSIYDSKYGCGSLLNRLCEEIADWAKDKGFDPTDWGNFPEKLMLISTELGEALQEFRKIKCIPGIDTPNPTDNFSKEDKERVSNIGFELADAAIRLFSMAAELDFDLERSIAEKMFVNEGRPYKHNRRC